MLYSLQGKKQALQPSGPQPLVHSPSSISVPPTCGPSPAYLSWLQPLVELPSAKPLCEQEEQDDFLGLGCHSDGRLPTETSIRSWGTAVLE
jgi:hypothetical protein